MLTQLLVAPLFIAASAVAHPAVMRRGDVSLSDWSSQNLEVRYNSLNCGSQTGSDFYTSCCYPLGASESLSDRPAECTPTSTTCSGSTYSSFSTPTPTPDASSTDDTYDESSLPWCEPGDDGYDDEEADTYTDAAYNGGSTSPNNTPTTDYSQPQPTNNGDNNNNNNNNNGGDNSGSTTTAPSDNSGGNTGGNTGGSTGGANTGGHATYYYQGGNPGACGDYHSDSDYIGAIDIAWYGYDTSQKSQYCGRSVKITRTDNGRSVDIIVADVCPTCDAANSFDLSVAAFQAIGDLSEGLIPISWSFN